MIGSVPREYVNDLRRRRGMGIYSRGMGIYSLPYDVLGYKQVRVYGKGLGLLYETAVMVLIIPASARFHVSYLSHKCRAEIAYSLDVTRANLDGVKLLSHHSSYALRYRNQGRTQYLPHKWLIPSFFDLRHAECSGGIHFFFRYEEARSYVF